MSNIPHFLPPFCIGSTTTLTLELVQQCLHTIRNMDASSHIEHLVVMLVPYIRNISGSDIQYVYTKTVQYHSHLYSQMIYEELLYCESMTIYSNRLTYVIVFISIFIHVITILSLIIFHKK